MDSSVRCALLDRLERFDRAVEIGIGEHSAVAAGLAARGVDVTATDVHERTVPPDVRFVRDDVTDPDQAVYADADVVYALRLPPELHRPTRAVAHDHDAAFLFTTLGADQPAVPVERETLPVGTLYRALPERP